MKLFSKRLKDTEIITEEINTEEKKEALLEEVYENTVEQKLATVENCCDQMNICQQRLEVAKKEYKEVNHYLADINTIENLNSKTKDELIYEVKRINTLNEDKKSYKASSTKLAQSKYDFIHGHEDDMSKILKNLKDSEDEYKSINTDIHNIEGEKSALKYERKNAITRMNTLRMLLAVVIATAMIVIGLLSYGQIKSRTDYTIGFYLVIIVALACIAAILATYKKQLKNLKIAEIKLNKCIGLLNRYKLRYVNVKSSLDYLYEVYGVANAYELNNLWRLYLTAKKEREAYFTMSDNLYKATEEYMAIIKSLKLYDASVWNYQMNAIVDATEMEVIKTTLHNRRDTLKKNLDYNNNIINKSKEKIKQIIQNDPKIADSVMAVIDKKELEFAQK